MRTVSAIRRCATWLAFCLSIGWERKDLDELERIWWRWHDDAGELMQEPRETQ